MKYAIYLSLFPWLFIHAAFAQWFVKWAQEGPYRNKWWIFPLWFSGTGIQGAIFFPYLVWAIFRNLP